MVSSSAREWAGVLNEGLRSPTSSPQVAWGGHVPDLKALASFLLQVEAQLDRARIDCLRSAMSTDQLGLLWQHKAREVQQTMHEAALHTCLPDSWLAQPVLDAIEAWNRDLRAMLQGPLHFADLLHFQRRLEAMADSLYLYALARRDHWEAVSPPR